ncbi:MAG: hydroxylamine oxidoreductase [Candidatus Brocadiales bacterium]|nr:hydroxylamine oxidoreductase [Candidatus Bathyanammoxibius amoris]
MHRLREPRYFLSLAVLMFLGLCLYVAASEDTALAFWGKDEKAAAGESSVNTQEFFAKLREEALGPDDCGRVFPMGGLTATYTGPEKLFPAYGKYGKLFNFLPLIRWYDPAHYYNSEEYHPGSPVKGQFKNDECIVCHTIQTPGVVALWKRSKHAFPGFGKAEVGCDKCHGNDHQKLTMPDYNTCGKCHNDQMVGHRAGEVGSHAHAYSVGVLEASWQIEKPAEEVSACATCHAIVENRCDGCHTRHEFSAAEARKPNNCGVCHTGLDHYEYEMYNQSYHGMLYQANGSKWDWSKPMKPENYQSPSCAYCHMQGGDHNVMKASTIHSNMGTALVDRGAPQYTAKRDGWIKLCAGCHSPRFARDQMEAVDEAVKVSFTKYREAVGIVASLYEQGLLDPMPADLAPDWTGHFTFSYYPGGELRMHNTSDIERMNFELLVYVTNAVYKAMAHFAWYNATYGLGAFKQDRLLTQIKAEASRLRRFAAIEKELGIEHQAENFWKHGEYTDLLLGWKIKQKEAGKATPTKQ